MLLVFNNALHSKSFVRLPVCAIVLNVIVALLLSSFYKDDAVVMEQAERMLDLVSGSSITIVTLTFSLTVLSVQIAAGSYSPRLLEDFLKDPISKVMISINVGAYAYCYTLTFFLGDKDDDVPVLAVYGLTVRSNKGSSMILTNRFCVGTNGVDFDRLCELYSFLS